MLAKNKQVITDSMNTVMATQATMNFFLSASLVHVLGMFHSLQVMCFQTMMNLQYPSNAQLFVTAIISILNVDILNPDWINDYIFEFKMG